MSETTQNITYQADSAYSAQYSFDMYQEEIDQAAKYPSYSDINLMIAYARSGKSAFAALSSNEYAELIGDNVHINLNFYVRINPTGRPYSLSLNMGTIQSQGVIQQRYNNNIVLPMSDTITFPTSVTIVSFAWVSNAYDESGQVVSYPIYTVMNNQLVFSKTVFAIARVVYELVEHKYTAQLIIPKTETQGIQGEQETTLSVTEVKPIVTAVYEDEKGEEQVESLTLVFPQIVQDYLAACPDDEKQLVIDWGGSDIGKTESVTYYYSTCTGEIIDIIRKDL